MLVLRHQDSASCDSYRTNSKVDKVEKDFTVPDHVRQPLEHRRYTSAIALALPLARSRRRERELFLL